MAAPSLDPALAALLARAAAAPAPFHRAVATDADGTLWTADVGDQLFLALGRAGDFRGAAREALRHRARALLGDPIPPDDGALAEALLARYAAGEISVEVMCDLEAEALGDRSELELQALSEHVAELVAGTVRPEVRALLVAAREAGFGLHVVSGSLGLGVEVSLRRCGIPFDTVSGAVLATRDGRVQATLAEPIPLYAGKVTALQATGAWPAALGLGDGGWDVVFLRDVHVPVLVHPKPALRAALGALPHVVTLGAP